jgi:hypothetical protein
MQAVPGILGEIHFRVRLLPPGLPGFSLRKPMKSLSRLAVVAAFIFLLSYPARRQNARHVDPFLGADGRDSK